jgi:DNA repair protein RadC
MLEPKLQVSEIQVSYKPSAVKKQTITDSQDAFNVLREFFSPDTIALQEQIHALYVNNANQVLGVYGASLGGITGTVCDIRLILSVALRIAATGVIISHNHPSGSMKPSRQDEELTRKLKEAGKVMDVKLLDHLIVHPSGTQFFSFADEGLL